MSAASPISAAMVADAQAAGCVPQAGPVMRPLSDLDELPDRNPEELFSNDYLSAGGAAEIVSGTGQGKSSLICGLSAHAAAGLPFLGLRPVRPLRSWLVQAENDDYDLRDFFRGALFQLRRDAGDAAASAAQGRVRFAQVNTLAGESLMEWIRGRLDATPAADRPDLLFLDPAFAFVDGDACLPADVSRFCRRQLNPLLTQYRLGLFIVHHANKPRKDAAPMAGSEFAYLGAGAAEWANWARAVLSLVPTPLDGVFTLHAGKRGGRLGWTDASGRRTYRRHIAHSALPGEPFYWREATADEIAQLPADRSGTGGRPAADVEALAGMAAKLCKRKTGLQEYKGRLCSELNIGRPTAEAVLRRLFENGALTRFKDGAAWYVKPGELL